MPVDPAVRRAALGALLLGFVGPEPPSWLLRALADGLGGVVLFGSNVRGRDPRELTDALRAAAGREAVVALDEEGGDVTRLDDTTGSTSPGAAALGHLDDVSATEAVAAEIAGRLARAGITVNLAPVADVNVEPLNPVIGVRSFGSSPELVARHVAATVRGTQRVGVAACAKHFPGHGATVVDSHHAVPVLTRSADELRAVEFAPFRAAVAAGARAVMTGHLVAPALDPTAIATVSRSITHDVLREELGFEGTVVTDALEMKALSGPMGLADGFVRALAAGADAIESGALDYPDLVDDVPTAVASAMADGRLTIERLLEAAHRTAALAAPAADPGPAPDTYGIAARCIEVVGVVPRVRAPLVIECRPPGGMASGELPWSLADPLSSLVPGTAARSVAGAEDVGRLAALTIERPLVVVVRDPDRHTWQLDVLALAEARPGTVVVDVGWPASAFGSLPTVRTRGVAPGLLAAAAAVLARGSP